MIMIKLITGKSKQKNKKTPSHLKTNQISKILLMENGARSNLLKIQMTTHCILKVTLALIKSKNLNQKNKK